MKKVVCTLCFVIQGDKILLGMKKKGFGMGKWNGFGGKVKDGEEIEQGAIREMKEECGLDIYALRQVGILRFQYPERSPAKEIEAHVFAIEDYGGEIVESGEMKPRWFRISDIPYPKMWPDDEHWLPLFLEGRSFTGSFQFGKKDDIMHHDLRVVPIIKASV